MVSHRDEEIVAHATAQPKPAALVSVDLHNFKGFNILLGHKQGDLYLERVEAALRALGTTWRTGGDEFVALIRGPLSSVTARVGQFSWLFHTVVGATEAWSFRFSDGRRVGPVPWRSFQVMTTPRCGVSAIEADASHALALARSRCEALRGIAGAAIDGFAPLAAQSWTNETLLSERVCPVCDGTDLTATHLDLGQSQESCGACGSAYERVNVLSVLGDVFDAGYA